MKLFNRISLLLISSLVFAACERDYDAPPLNEPKYDGPGSQYHDRGTACYGGNSRGIIPIPLARKK